MELKTAIDEVLAADAAPQLELSRERVVREIQRGLLKGRRTENGNWVVDRREVEKRVAERASARLGR